MTPHKICTMCRKNLPVFEFDIKKKSKKKREEHCRNCRRTYKIPGNRRRPGIYMDTREAHETRKKRGKRRHQHHVEKLRKVVLQHLAENPCVDCGEDDPIVLTFDHVRGVKMCGISQIVHMGLEMEALLKEMAKCEVRCSNCHRRKEAVRFNYRVVEAYDYLR